MALADQLSKLVLRAMEAQDARRTRAAIDGVSRRPFVVGQARGRRLAAARQAAERLDSPGR